MSTTEQQGTTTVVNQIGVRFPDGTETWSDIQSNGEQYVSSGSGTYRLISGDETDDVSWSRFVRAFTNRATQARVPVETMPVRISRQIITVTLEPTLLGGLSLEDAAKAELIDADLVDLEF